MVSSTAGLMPVPRDAEALAAGENDPFVRNDGQTRLTALQMRSIH